MPRLILPFLLPPLKTSINQNSSHVCLQRTLRPLPSCRFASSSASRARTLEKPTRFNPPSHPSRRRDRVPRSYGPELTAEQKQEQEKRYYPNMMPPEGTFMHWFLSSRGIHLWITMVSRGLYQLRHLFLLNVLVTDFLREPSPY